MDTTNGGDFPDYVASASACIAFLNEFKERGRARPYATQLQAIANRQSRVLVVHLDDVAKFDPALALHAERDARRFVALFETAADAALPLPTVAIREMDVLDVLLEHRKQLVEQSRDAEVARNPENILPPELTRRFELVMLPREDAEVVPLRQSRAVHVGGLVRIEGVVTRITDVRPLVTVATYTCEECGNELYQLVDGRHFTPLAECASATCRRNGVKGRLTMQTRGSRFVKFQELRLQELPDQVPVGNVPRALTVHVRGELTRTCTAGSRITVEGVFLPTPYTGFKALRAGLTADAYLHAMSIKCHKQAYADLKIDAATDAKIEKIVQEPSLLQRLYRSLAPEIYGLDDVKEALLLLLIGGVTKKRKDGMRIRGDINILLMGDPGVAKSQLLKHIATVAPRACYTTGKGSSGVGLTAAVMKDTVTNEMVLEGGALVLADNGICCIDEFDKMDEADRTAIHEVMEQQTVSIAKAGITTTLNARTAILAAANPLYGRYRVDISPEDNINLPPALLSRFDLLFVLRDVPDVEKDRRLADHILHVHQHLKEPPQQHEPLPTTLLRAFIARARQCTPCVPRDLTHYLVEAYVQMRRDGADIETDDLPCTPRSLLSLLRLAQALARTRLADTVSYDDVEEAIRLMHECKATSEVRGSRGFKPRDYQTAIWEMIRKASLQQQTSSLKKTALLEQARRKGYSLDQFNETLSVYENLNILQIGRTSVTVV